MKYSTKMEMKEILLHATKYYTQKNKYWVKEADIKDYIAQDSIIIELI